MLDRLLKTLAVLAVLSTALFFALWLRHPQNQPISTADSRASYVATHQLPYIPSQTTPLARSMSVITAPPSNRPLAQVKGTSPYAEKPKDMIVEFELINGTAIAYGDTVLGKPAEGQTMGSNRGSTEAPLPQYWKNGVVPYGIQPGISNPKRIEDAVDFFNQHTSVKFVPYQGQPDAIIFEKGEQHCYSYLGRVGGLQPVSLADNCGTSEIMHELMHALGFVHEQSRTDRDRFVEILWDNIEEKFKPQFAMVPEAMMDAYHGALFDEHSIMMYDPKIFTIKPGLQNMRSLSSVPLESHTSLSDQDIHRVNRLYGFE